MELLISSAPALLIHATYRVQPDGAEAFRSIALRGAAVAKARDGCVFFDVVQSAEDPATFRMVEGWQTRATLDAHLGSAKFQSVLKGAKALGILDFAADVYAVMGREPLEMPS
jgi:quinol monooxygenase YgiN